MISFIAPLLVASAVQIVVGSANVAVAAEAPAPGPATTATDAPISSNGGTTVSQTKPFYTVYVAAVDKLAVGASVSVEPVFLTDGEEVIPFYEYCRATFGGNPQGSVETIQKVRTEWNRYLVSLARQGAPDVERIKPFCQNKSLEIDATGYVVRDNLGTEIGLDRVWFKSDQVTPKLGGVMPPVCSLSGTAKVHRVDLHNRPAPLRAPKYANTKHYFLMAVNRDVLKLMLPTYMTVEREVNVLLSAADTMFFRDVGMTNKICQSGTCPTRWDAHLRQIAVTSFRGIEVVQRAPMMADIDDDGKLDFAAHGYGLQSVEIMGFPAHWEAMGIVFGNGTTVMDGEIIFKGQEPPPEYSTYHDPIALLKIRNCTFLFATRGYFGAISTGADMYAMPRQTNECSDISFLKTNHLN